MLSDEKATVGTRQVFGCKPTTNGGSLVLVISYLVVPGHFRFRLQQQEAARPALYSNKLCGAERSSEAEHSSGAGLLSLPLVL